MRKEGSNKGRKENVLFNDTLNYDYVVSLPTVRQNSKTQKLVLLINNGETEL